MHGKQVDVLIIGSGIGGMGAAAYLANKGYQVLVTEALPRIGGHCSTFQYRGIQCTTGVVGPGLGGPLENLFREVGAEYDVRPCGIPRYLINGKIVELPPKKGLRALLSAATSDSEEVERLLKAFSLAISSEEPAQTMRMRQWLNRYTQNPAVLELFQTMAAATAIVSIDSLTARGFFQFLRQHRGFREWGVCPRGSIALPNSLARVVENHRGEIWTSSPALSIHSEGGKALGATVSREGRSVRVQAAVVISNCGPQRTVAMAGKDNLGSAYVKALEKLTPAKAISIHIKSDIPLIDKDHLLVVGARRIVAIFQLTAVCPELAPPGTHYLVAAADPVGSLAPAEAKKEIDLSLQDLKQLLPNFDSHAQILLTGVYHGGWPAMFSIAGQTMHHATPIKNLYAVGDGFINKPGMTALAGAVDSGVAAAKDICLHLKPRR